MDNSTGRSPKLGKPLQSSATAFLNITALGRINRRFPCEPYAALTLGGYGSVRVITYSPLGKIELTLSQKLII